MSSTRLARLFHHPLRNTVAIFLLFCSVANAQTAAHPRWALQYFGENGSGWHDEPDCGPLEEFKGDPKRFDYADGVLKLGVVKDDVTAKRIGEISGFAVWDVIHDFGDAGPARGLVMKMIVVERKPGEFCEIFQQEFDRLVFMTPPYFINAGEQVLATTDDMSGSAGLRIEGYWVFDKDGPLPLDLSPIDEAVKELVPDGYSVPKYPFAFARGQFDGNTIKTLSVIRVACTRWIDNRLPDGPCGQVRVSFVVKDHKLTAVTKAFVPLK